MNKGLNRTFICPLCKQEIEKINEHLAKCSISKQLEFGLSNKRFHMQQHREERRAREKRVRTALRQAEVVRLRENNAGI